MEYDRAIEILENEVLCMQTRAAGCKKNCEKCQLKLSDHERFQAIGKAIQALKEQQKNSIRQGR